MASGKILVLCGPTAVGKTSLSIEVAKQYNGEIISADSRQFFREMSIGTAKPSDDELNQVPHHFINSHSIQENYTAGKFEADALQLIDSILGRKKLPIIVGGSGLYIQAILQGFDQPPSDESIRVKLENELTTKGKDYLQSLLKEKDPEKYKEIDIQNPRRLVRALEIIELESQGKLKPTNIPERNFEPIVVVLNRDREELYERINSRVDQMINEGLLMEVEGLKDYRDQQALQTVGYKELFEFLDGKLSLEDAVALIKQNSRRYAKRQLTWFRKLADSTWIDANNKKSLFDLIDSQFKD